MNSLASIAMFQRADTNERNLGLRRHNTRIDSNSNLLDIYSISENDAAQWVDAGSVKHDFGGEEMSFHWKASLSKVIFMTDTSGWTYYFYGICFCQHGIGFIKRVRI